MKIARWFLLGLVFLTCCLADTKDDALDLRQRVKRLKLDNGMTALFLKREGAPVFSTQLKVKVGNIEEDKGAYGLAHFFEHMAFKGTSKIGTTDFETESKLMAKIEEVGTQLVELKKRGRPATDPQVTELLKTRQTLESEHNNLLVKSEFNQILQRHGGVGLNATTSNDFTTFYISLPVNKMEMWAYMESERFIDPVLRGFFTEVDVVAEERRMRIDNTPEGRLYEAFVERAFDESPYKVVVIGPPEDIQLYTPKQAKEFYSRFYIPSRMVLSLVGNFDLKEAEKIVRRYFSRIPAKKDTQKTHHAQKLDESFPREVIIKRSEKPRFYLGYHRPAHPHVDDIIFDVIQEILCSGRTARLYRKFVLNEKTAASVACYVSVPGARLDSLFSFYAMPHEGVTSQTLRDEIIQELLVLAEQGPTDRELERVKNMIDAELIYSLRSNSGLASQLAFYESLTGNWEYIYELQDKIHKVTAEDVKRVAKTYFVPQRQVTAYLEQGK